MRIDVRMPLLVPALLAVLLASAASGAELPGRWRGVPLGAPGETPSPASCTVITSDCEACAFRADGTFACSTPGIACEPRRWTCMQLVAEQGKPGQPR